MDSEFSLNMFERTDKVLNTAEILEFDDVVLFMGDFTVKLTKTQLKETRKNVGSLPYNTLEKFNCQIIKSHAGTTCYVLKHVFVD